MLQQLKEDTKINHSAVEKVLVSRLKNLKSTEDYANILIDLYGFFGAVELKVHDILSSNLVANMDQRMHVRHLKWDIINLQYQPIEKDNLFAKKIKSISYALGVLYVMEGSTLGGQVICKMLTKLLPSLQENHLSYFASYGEKTSAMWTSFKDSIEALAGTINENEMTSGAKDTFEALRLWLLKESTMQ